MPLRINDELSLGFKGIMPIFRLKGGIVRDGVPYGNILHCDDCGKDVRLTKDRTVRGAVSIEVARERAAKAGWSRGEPGTNDDFCPACTIKRRPPIQWNTR